MTGRVGSGVSVGGRRQIQHCKIRGNVWVGAANRSMFGPSVTFEPVKCQQQSGRSPIPVAYCHTEEEPTNGCPCRSDTIFDIVKRDRAA